MSLAPVEPPLVPLRLSSREQWVLHHVLSDRIERARRHTQSPPPPREIADALEKVESGSLLFTAAELRRAREALQARARNRTVSPRERREIGNLVDRIDRALARHRSLRAY